MADVEAALRSTDHTGRLYRCPLNALRLHAPRGERGRKALASSFPLGPSGAAGRAIRAEEEAALARRVDDEEGASGRKTRSFPQDLGAVCVDLLQAAAVSRRGRMRQRVQKENVARMGWRCKDTARAEAA
jgi:hypothetical protein